MVATVNVEGIFAQVSGAGEPALVFVHGGHCTGRDWRHQVAALSTRFRTIVPDLIGHGRSGGSYQDFTVEGAAEQVNRLIGSLGVERPVLVGHSLGARIVIQMAADRPQGVRGVVLMDGGRSRSTYPPQDLRPSDQEMPAAIIAAFNAMFNEKTAPKLKQRVMSDIEAVMQRKSVGDLLHILNAVTRWDVEQFDHALSQMSRVAVLAVQSTYMDARVPRYSLEAGDRSTPWLDYLAGTLERLKVVIVPGVGHFNMLEAPDQVTEAIKVFAEAL